MPKPHPISNPYLNFVQSLRSLRTQQGYNPNTKLSITQDVWTSLAADAPDGTLRGLSARMKADLQLEGEFQLVVLSEAQERGLRKLIDDET
jgi:hypothetical protein